MSLLIVGAAAILIFAIVVVAIARGLSALPSEVRS